MSNSKEHPSVGRLQEYLQIKSVHPDPDYESCIKWLQTQAEEIGLEFHLAHFNPPPGFAVWLTWTGSDPKLKSIMFNSHMDVVPVDSSKWTHDPFAAKKHDGKIFARGVQDMKSVGAQHLEAVRKLKADGFVPLRTVHITFVPDEEIGGTNGMAKFVESPEFKNLNIAFEIDEGGPSPTAQYLCFYGERALWQLKITITGNTGHALNFVENTCMEKLQKIMDGFLKIREEEKEKLGNGPDKLVRLSHFTTLNITMINGGLQPNVVPPELTVVVDMRITPKGWTESKALNLVQKVIDESGPGITYEFINKNPLLPETPIDDSNPWWCCLRKSFEEMNLELLPLICPGVTDGRFVRSKGLPVIGFSPMNTTPMLLHDHDEYLDEQIFLNGIDVFAKIMKDLASLQISP